MKNMRIFFFAAALAIASLIHTVAHAADVNLLVVAKGKEFHQSSSAEPVLETGDPYLFETSVHLSSSGVGSTASIKTPNDAIINLSGQFVEQPDLLEFQDSFGASQELEAAFPNGDYTFTVQTINDGVQTVVLNLSGDAYPDAPRIINFDAAQAIDPESAFVLSWMPFAGGTTNDFVVVEIFDASDEYVFETPDPGEPGALNGTATSVVIPANTLSPGQTYEVELMFVKIASLDVETYPGAVGASVYFTITEFDIHTTGEGDTEPPTLVSSNPTDNATGVSVDTTISFTFSEPMAPGHSITWGGAFFEGDYFWSTDKKTLTVAISDPLPIGRTITWVLNPSSHGLSFRDLAGNPLPADVYSGKFTTEIDATTPELVSSNPADDAEDVPLDTALAFTFNEPMAVAWSIDCRCSAENISIDAFVWSQDAKTLTLTFSSDLPPNSVVTWILNPSGLPQHFKDQAGNPLPADVYSGKFNTAALAPAQLSGPVLLPGGYFNFTVNGAPARTYLIQASTNLVDWVDIQSASSPSGIIPVTDIQASLFDHRFYRAIAE